MKASLTSAVLAGLATALILASPASPAVAADCAGSLQNGSFEAPVLSALVVGDVYATPSAIWNGPGSGTTYAMVKTLPDTNTAVSSALVWQSTETAVEIQNITPFVGDQYAEIVGLDSTAALYQSVATTPGVVMDWSLAHRGWSPSGPDSMRVMIGSSLLDLVAQNATPSSGSGVVGQPTVISDSSDWRTWTGTYTVPAGQTVTYFAFNSIDSYSGANSVGNYIDDITFSCSANQPSPEEPSPQAPSSEALPVTGFAGVTLGIFGGTLFAAGIGFAMLRRRLRA